MGGELKVGDVGRFGDRETVYEGGPMVKLELSASCNASCVFCAMNRHPLKPRGFLSFADTVRFVDLNAGWLVRAGWRLEPFFNGESLLNPRFFDIMDLLVGRGIRLGDLDTNLGLDVDIPRLAAYPWRAVTVNIGGVSESVHRRVMGTDLRLVRGNVAALLAESARRYPVYVKMNPVRDNLSEIPLLSEFCRGIGPGLRWKDQQTGLPVPADLPPEEVRAFLAAVYDPAGARYFRFAVEDGELRVGNPRCIYQTPCVCSDGGVTVCAHDQLRHVDCGNAFETPLENILSSARYLELRARGERRELPFCRGCN